MEEKNILKSIIFLLILSIITILLFKDCKKDEEDNIVINRDTIINVIDTAYIIKPDSIEVIKPVYIKIPNDTIIDTVIVIKDFYTKVYATDTVMTSDSLVRVVINDTIYKNSIDYRDVLISYSSVEKTITNTIYNDGLYLGLGLSSSNKIGLGLNCNYAKNKSIYGISAYTNGIITINYSYKIK